MLKELSIMKHYMKLSLAFALGVVVWGCSSISEEPKDPWVESYNSKTKERFIPVELFYRSTMGWQTRIVLKRSIKYSLCLFKRQKMVR